MAVALALLTSIAYGSSNYLGPRLARGAPVFVLLIAGQSCSLALSALVVAGQGDAVPAGDAVAAALVAGLGNAFGLVLFYRAAATGPLSIVTPIGALGAAVPVAYGLSQGESLTALKAAGIVLALGGLALVARRPSAAAAAAGPPVPKEHDRRRAVVLALASAFFFGLFLAAMGPASEDSSGWAVLLSRASLVVILLAVALSTGAQLRLPAARLPLLVIPGILLFAGTLAYAAATREGDLSVVSVVGSLFPVVTVGLALGLDRERLSPAQLAGAIATMAGIVALSAR
ncbi:MAG: DMT family transporter [Actinomycetota bacterium]|nr:DMT family transporter [Actinomycetota bacterium]